jgi:hypothetical protein
MFFGRRSASDNNVKMVDRKRKKGSEGLEGTSTVVLVVDLRWVWGGGCTGGAARHTRQVAGHV